MSIVGSRKFQAVAWAALTAVALLAPGRQDDNLPGWLPAVLEPYADKAVHLTLFFVLVLLTNRAVNPERGGRQRLGTTLLSVGLFMLLLEIGQLWVPNRIADALDVLAGLAGALMASSVILAKYR